MILNIISRPGLWRAADMTGDVVNVPASVAALLDPALGRGRRLTPSEVLGRDEYLTIWRDSLSFLNETIHWEQRTPDEPDLLRANGYSVYLLLCQVFVLERFFDALRERHAITRVRVESVEGLEDTDYVFYLGGYTSYFHDVARRWALARGMECDSVDAVGWRAVATSWADAAPPPFLKRRMMAFLDRFVFPPMMWGRHVLRYLAGGRHFILYMPSQGAGLGYWTPSFAINIAPFLHLAPQRNDTKPAQRADRELSEALKRLGPLYSIVAERFAQHLERSSARAVSLFHWARSLIIRLKRWGVTPAFAAAGMGTDWGGNTPLMEAFRSAGCCVGGVQHGGNTRLMGLGGTPSLLAEYNIATHYFHWGRGAREEHEGVTPSALTIRSVHAGSPRTLFVTGHTGRRSRKAGPLRVLYAPSLVSVQTTHGNNIAWDRYVPIILEALQILSDSGLDVTVKVLNTVDMDFLAPSDYPRLRLARSGRFVDLIEQSDILIVDSLAGSPLYESLATDRPIIVYAGAENQEWDEAFLASLKKRAAVLENKPDFLAMLRRLAQEPEKVAAELGGLTSREVLDSYLCPIEPDRMWGTIFETFFGRRP